MTAEEIRDQCRRNVESLAVVWDPSGSKSDAIAALQYAALQEIAAQIAEFNERLEYAHSIVRMWSQEKGFDR